MFSDAFQLAAEAAKAKAALWKKNPAGYFLASMLAGAFISFGGLLAFTVGGQMNGAGYAKLFMGAVFAAALSMVTMAGAELFTGNNLVMAAGVLKKTISFGKMLGLWAVCWLGNLAGSVLLGLLYHGTGLGAGAIGEFMAAAAFSKMTAGPVALLCRGVLCNVLVCLAVWCGFRCKTESGKLIMVFWCVLAFFTTGFEHSIANMTLFTAVLLNPCGTAVSLSGALYNLALVTLGNIAGGAVLVALPYYAIGRK